MTMIRLFKGGYFVAEEDSDTGEVSIEFPHARYFTLVRFTLLESERHRYNDEKYIDDLITSYRRDRGKFCQKRRVTTG